MRPTSRRRKIGNFEHSASSTPALRLQDAACACLLMHRGSAKEAAEGQDKGRCEGE